MKNYVKHLEWSDIYFDAQAFGIQFIDVHKAKELAERTGDGHVIVKTLTGSEIPSWLGEKIKSKPLVIQIFGITPNSTGMVHKDGLDRKSALNIPLINCDKGYMDWFDEEYNQVTIDNDYTKIRLTGKEKHKYKFRIVTPPSHRCLINTPSIVNTDIWHRVDNLENPDFRFMMSIRFEGNPSFEEMCNGIIK